MEKNDYPAFVFDAVRVPKDGDVAVADSGRIFTSQGFGQHPLPVYRRVEAGTRKVTRFVFTPTGAPARAGEYRRSPSRDFWRSNFHPTDSPGYTMSEEEIEVPVPAWCVAAAEAFLGRGNAAGADLAALISRYAPEAK